MDGRLFQYPIAIWVLCNGLFTKFNSCAVIQINIGDSLTNIKRNIYKPLIIFETLECQLWNCFQTFRIADSHKIMINLKKLYIGKMEGDVKVAVFEYGSPSHRLCQVVKDMEKVLSFGYPFNAMLATAFFFLSWWTLI